MIEHMGGLGIAVARLGWALLVEWQPKEGVWDISIGRPVDAAKRTYVDVQWLASGLVLGDAVKSAIKEWRMIDDN